MAASDANYADDSKTTETPDERNLTDKIKDRLKMGGQLKQAVEVLKGFAEPKFVKADYAIPIALLKKAKGVAIISELKAGLLFAGGIIGTGIVVSRLPSGRWSGPASIGAIGGAGGLMMGVSKTDSVIVLNTDEAVNSFSGQGQIRIGADLQVAAGPVGREVSFEAGVGTNTAIHAPAFAYSHSKGLFAGATMQGLIISSRDADNEEFYGKKTTSHEILNGTIFPAEDHDDLKTLHAMLDSMLKGNPAEA